MQLNPVIDLSSLSRFAPAEQSRVGTGFQQVQPGTLVEKNDQYEDERGAFVPFTLEDVGRPVPSGLLVRRIERRQSYSY